MTQQEFSYRVVVHPEDGAFWAEVEDLPGCFASGDTMDDLWEALEEAVGLYLSDESGDVTVQVMFHEPASERHEARMLVCS